MSNKSRFVWHDLNTRDTEGAKRFYGELFNWSFEKSDNGPYQHIKTGAEMIGGIRQMESTERMPPSWLGYVSVDDVQATVTTATAHGGKVFMPPTAMPDVGTFAVVADPTGGVIAPWRSAHPEQDKEPAGTTPVHSFCWDELLTLDPTAAAKFYTGVFGWGTESEDMGPMGTYTLFTRPGVKNPMQPEKSAWAAGMMKAPPTVPHSFWMAYVQVADSDASAERAKKLGATVVVPPTDIPNIGRFCAFMDPQNAALAFISFPKP